MNSRTFRGPSFSS